MMLNCVFSRRYRCRALLVLATATRHPPREQRQTLESTGCGNLSRSECSCHGGHRNSRKRSQDHSTAASYRFHRFVAQVARSAGRSPRCSPSQRTCYRAFLQTAPHQVRRTLRLSLMHPHVISMSRNQLCSQETVCGLVGKRMCVREMYVVANLAKLVWVWCCSDKNVAHSCYCVERIKELLGFFQLRYW